MKIKELTNAPRWLIDAIVRDEDVEIDQYGQVQWNRGDFLGGNFRGGDFWAATSGAATSGTATSGARRSQKTRCRFTVSSGPSTFLKITWLSVAKCTSTRHGPRLMMLKSTAWTRAL